MTDHRAAVRLAIDNKIAAEVRGSADPATKEPAAHLDHLKDIRETLEPLAREVETLNHSACDLEEEAFELRRQVERLEAAIKKVDYKIDTLKAEAGS